MTYSIFTGKHYALVVELIFSSILIHQIIARFPTEPNARRYVSEFHSNKTSNVEVFTKHPHPHEPPPPIPGDDFNTSMVAPFPLGQSQVEVQIDNFFNELVRQLCHGERIKMTILTTDHQWFKLEVLPCFEKLREAVDAYCFQFRNNVYAQKYRFVLMNCCNAAWLDEVEVHDVIKNTCEADLGKQTNSYTSCWYYN